VTEKAEILTKMSRLNLSPSDCAAGLSPARLVVNSSEPPNQQPSLILSKASRDEISRPPSNNNLIPELAVQAPASPKKKGGVKIGFGEDKVKEIEAREPEEKSDSPEEDENRPSPRQMRRTARRSTVIDMVSLLQNNGIIGGGIPSGRDSALKRRSTRGASFMEITRRYSMANKLKKKARGVKKCVFEVNQHSVKEVCEKILEESNRVSKSDATDLYELVQLIEALSEKTSKERDTFEEEYIKFHIAQKREVDFPKNMQNEVDTMARNVRNENIALIARLKAERRKIDEDLELFGQEGGLLEHMNSNLIDQKELTDELVAKLVTGLNQRMSLKAQTQIQVNKTMEEIGQFVKKIEGFPEKLEMLAINLEGQIEELKLDTKEALVDSEEAGVAIVETGDQVIDIKKEHDLLQEKVKEHQRVISKGNDVLEARLSRVFKESDAHQKHAEMKRETNSKAKKNRDFALETKLSTENQDDSDIKSWQLKISNLIEEIEKAENELKQAKDTKLEYANRERETNYCITNLETDLRFQQKKLSELKEAVDEKGKDVDNKTEEKMYLNNQLQNALEDAKVTKALLDGELQRYSDANTMEREARNNLVNEWQLVDKAINNTKRELSNFKADRNEITADLEKERTARASLFKQSGDNLTVLETRTRNTRTKLKVDTDKFEKQENDMQNLVNDITRSLEDNTLKVEELTSILSVRQPVYEEHQSITAKNENRHESCKMKLARANKAESDLKRKILKTDQATKTLDEKFSECKSEKDKIQAEMTLMMKNSSVRIGKLDKENYNLLVEWEQYRAENVRIQSFRDKSEKNIRAMVRSDRRVSVQLVEYSNHLKSQKAELERMRTRASQIFAQSEREKTNILMMITNFENQTKHRLKSVSNAQSKLTNLATNFENYVNNVDQNRAEITRRKPPSSSMKKRRFRVEVTADMGQILDISELRKKSFMAVNSK